MYSVPIPESVLSFIVEHIDSVPHLETLILLWENPSQSWSPEEVAKRAYVSERVAGAILKDLRQRGLVRVDSIDATRYQYDATWDSESHLMKDISQTYRLRLVQIATLINSKASSSVREFARAFDLNKDR